MLITLLLQLRDNYRLCNPLVSPVFEKDVEGIGRVSMTHRKDGTKRSQSNALTVILDGSLIKHMMGITAAVNKRWTH